MICIPPIWLLPILQDYRFPHSTCVLCSKHIFILALFIFIFMYHAHFCLSAFIPVCLTPLHAHGFPAPLPIWLSFCFRSQLKHQLLIEVPPLFLLLQPVSLLQHTESCSFI